MGYHPLFRNGGAELTRLVGGSMGSDPDSCAENSSQSQMETSWVLTKPGFISGEERMMPLRETFLGDRELRLHCPHLSVRISMTNPLFQVLFPTKL